METYSCAQRWTIAPSLAKSYCPIMSDRILVAESKEQIFLLPKMSNRHGLIAGATGTGKTVTLQTLAEHFSARGVPVFIAGTPLTVEPVTLQTLAENFSARATPVFMIDVEGVLSLLRQPGGNMLK